MIRLSRELEKRWDEVIGVTVNTFGIMKYDTEAGKLYNEFAYLIPKLDEIYEMDEFDRIAYEKAEKSIEERLLEIKETAKKLSEKVNKELEEKRADKEAAREELKELLLQFDDIVETLEPAKEYFRKLLALSKRDVSCLSSAYNPFLDYRGPYLLFSEKALQGYEYIGKKRIEEIRHLGD